MSGPKITSGMHVMPSPTSYAVGEADLGDGTKVVALRIETVVGSFTFMLPAESARTFASQITAEANRVATGLQVARVVPPANIFNGGHKTS